MASNITPIEAWEEGLYSTLNIACIAGLVSSKLLILHLLIFHGTFSYIYLGIATVFLCGSIFFPWLKAKRFKTRNLSFGERIVRLENAVGEPA
jgi:hypothetical protein